MRKIKHYTPEEIASMTDLFRKGASFEEIAKNFGRTPTAIKQKLLTLGINANVRSTKDDVAPVSTEVVTKPVKEKALSDFTIREIIHHLYHERSCRFRVRNNRVVVVVEKEINLSDIING